MILPKIDSRWVFIGRNDRADLAAMTASYLFETDSYVAFFEFPTLKFPYRPSTDFGDDGYFHRAQGERVATRINNALVRVQPRAIVLLGLTDIEKGYIRAHLPPSLLVDVQTIEDVPRVLGQTPRFVGDVRCKRSELIPGLLKARCERKRLIVDEDAPPLPNGIPKGGDGLFVIEN